MAFIEHFIPPTRANYELVLKIWQFGFPALGSLQWVIKWYGMGKTSTPSRLNLPGRIAWFTMEVPGFLTLVYVMATLPQQHGVIDLPWQNRVLAGLFVLHYVYRAMLFPLLQPSMAPIHLSVWAMAVCFQLLNATCLGSWLAAYGPVDANAWAAQTPLPQFALGLAIFYAGLAANFFYDEELREIRRRKKSRHTIPDDKKSASFTSHYEIPQAGLFRYMLFPHYFCEWVEWFGFLMAAGWSCAPAWAFLVNEISSMLPRAVRGKAWYAQKFGREKFGSKWAVIPGVW